MRLRTRDESPVHLHTRLSMFDDVTCAHLSLTLPGWLLRLCLTRSMCACAQSYYVVHSPTRPCRPTLIVRCRRLLLLSSHLKCCALAHEALSSTFVVVIALVVVGVAGAT
jgi:hypothetical protein